MTEYQKDLMDLYKIKLDLIKPIFNTLLIFFGGAVGFLAVNFEKNTNSLNWIVSFGIILLFVFLSVFAKELAKTYKLMKGLL